MIPVTNSARTPNRLINETSPYLLQHAYNPVDWFPWCDEAFAKAKDEDKPVFLSIGYSTCHWCHVMAHESFEDDEVARALNTRFVPVKVDREERPDIDAVYMDVCQAVTGGGGWPLTVLMTPDKKPFFAGTYFPKRGRYGSAGLLELLDAAAAQWARNSGELKRSGGEIAQAVASWKTPAAAEKKEAGKQPVLDASKHLAAVFDKRYGGFGKAPKFPSPHNLMFLLRVHLLEGDAHALHMVETTLRQMYRGGIFDHIGFGFSRYSTDNRWLAPHFEKMLYDNALLVIALTECYQVTRNPLYREIAEKTLRYVGREMTSPEGGFYSAQDADSDGVEGKYYTFTLSEITEVLGEEDGKRFCERYDIGEKGNFEGVSIPNLIGYGGSLSDDPRLEPAREKLYRYRLSRTSLHKDDKILTSWNALMIAAYAKAYRAFGDSSYLRAAEGALTFIQKHLTDADGLRVSFRDGRISGKGLLDDYAFLAWVCLALYESTFDAAYLARAIALAEEAERHFADPQGGFFMSRQDNGGDLIFRPKEQYDGAMPSGNSVLAYCLARIASITGEKRWREAADRQISFYLPVFARQPQAHTFALTALMESVYPSRELICVLNPASEAAKLAPALAERLRPNLSILVKTRENEGELSRIAPFTKDYPVREDAGNAFYLCRERSCLAPVFSLEELLPQLDV